MTAPDLIRANVPADGESPGGRIVVPAPDLAFPADPVVYGEGLARLLDAVATVMPRAAVESVWAFPGVRREAKEYGVAVVTQRVLPGDAADEGRLRVYRARYTLIVKGQDRGTVVVEVEEIATAPADLLPSVIEGVRRRAEEAGDAEVVDLAPWKAADGDARP